MEQISYKLTLWIMTAVMKSVLQFYEHMQILYGPLYIIKVSIYNIVPYLFWMLGWLALSTSSSDYTDI